ncbi:hypothetical protein K491DRAFT_674602 [Lophiostoma macrostomum CBS 122681]|uniref:Uncharacterized protein n=1 Tax=Lophiostoma macrostomum CBS 122681 TaxID=1314788 RepID=A0A6A6TKU5_9PLEO|nr:hypothetical protein K491DRAFT_674602 [Lophiostoma macrostomum CBS 122681]
MTERVLTASSCRVLISSGKSTGGYYLHIKIPVVSCEMMRRATHKQSESAKREIDSHLVSLTQGWAHCAGSWTASGPPVITILGGSKASRCTKRARRISDRSLRRSAFGHRIAPRWVIRRQFTAFQIATPAQSERRQLACARVGGVRPSDLEVLGESGFVTDPTSEPQRSPASIAAVPSQTPRHGRLHDKDTLLLQTLLVRRRASLRTRNRRQLLPWGRAATTCTRGASWPTLRRALSLPRRSRRLSPVVFVRLAQHANPDPCPRPNVIQHAPTDDVWPPMGPDGSFSKPTQRR